MGNNAASIGDVELFLMENSDLSNTTRSKLLEILQDPQQLLALKVELAAIVDVGVHMQTRNIISAYPGYTLKHCQTHWFRWW